MKLLADAMKESKSYTTKRRRIKKSSVQKEQNVEIVEVREDNDIDSNIVIETKKRKQKFHDVERTRSFVPKSGSPVVSKKKCTAV